MVFELFLCELDGYIYIKSMLVIYFNCMSHYMDFNACFFRGDFSANECSCDISNWFEWKRTGDSREIYVCRFLGKLLQNADWGYVCKIYIDVMLKVALKIVSVLSIDHFRDIPKDSQTTDIAHFAVVFHFDVTNHNESTGNFTKHR